jgi:putative RNA 2'-phosphotransferase
MASSNALNKTSKFLSYVLRHKPEAIGIKLDENGWANIGELIIKGNSSSEASNLDRSLIREVIENSNKQRFDISEDGQSIRANQGHSIEVDLQLETVTPPEYLYHGTATRFLGSILVEGLKLQKRQHVHMSTDIGTAFNVGQRYGSPVILKIKALHMHEQGFEFFRSKNDIWLTDVVPIYYLES